LCIVFLKLNGNCEPVSDSAFFDRCEPNLVTYNILLRASAHDRVSYNGVIGAYGKAGDFVQMEKTLFVMRLRKHIKPDTVTSNTLIDSYGRGREFVKMEQVSVLFQSGSIFSPAKENFSCILEFLTFAVSSWNSSGLGPCWIPFCVRTYILPM
jgi:pentatricopeptide repeat protein